jgi:hypothetical protein
VAGLLIHQVEKASSLRAEILLLGNERSGLIAWMLTTAFSCGSMIWGHVELSSFSAKWELCDGRWADAHAEHEAV